MEIILIIIQYQKNIKKKSLVIYIVLLLFMYIVFNFDKMFKIITIIFYIKMHNYYCTLYK